MDVKIINPFLIAAVNVMKTMANVEPVPGKPFLKSESTALGDVSAIIGITGVAQGSMALTFTESCIIGLASNLMGMEFTDLNDEVKDSVGELTNMICGDARRRLSEKGVTLQAGIPTVVAGKSHSITHIASGPRLAVPFQTQWGSFIVEVAFNEFNEKK
jgi:chemotaxis protein CheX